MLTNLLNKLTEFNKVAGVEIIQISGNLSINAVVIQKKKDSIEIVSKHSNILSIEGLGKELPKSIPICISISSKSILHKKATEHDKAEKQEVKLLQSVMPNAKMSDFYLQQFENENSTFISIQRKQPLDDILAAFLKQKMFVQSVCFGPSSLSSIYDLTPNLPKPDFTIGHHHFTYVGADIETYQFNTTAVDEGFITVGKDELEGDLLVSFATAFEYFFPNPSKKLSNIESLNVATEDLKQINIFQKLGWTVLLIFLFTLVFNYFLFDYYHTKQEELEVIANSKQTEISEVQKLKKEIDYKRDLVALTGISTASKSSLYADDIAKSVLSDIQLLELELYPKVKDDIQKKKIQFNNSEILIRGYTSKSTVLNNWIKKLKQYSWVKDIHILDYKQSNTQSQGEFELRLDIDVR